MLGCAGGAGGEDRDVDVFGNGFGHWQVVTRLGAVGIHGSQDDFPRPQLLHLSRPGNRFLTRWNAAAIDVDLPKLGTAFDHAAWVDVHHRSATAKLARHGGDQLRRAYRGGIDTDLFGPRLYHARSVLKGANAAAHGEGHEDFLRNAPDHIEQDRSRFVARADIEEDKFIPPRVLVTARHLDGVAGVTQLEKVHTLHHPATVHIETGNNPFRQHRSSRDR